MKAIYNSRITNQEDIQISTINRAFCYGDGLFETIVTGPDRINLLDFHLGRLKRDSASLKIAFPSKIEEKLKEWIDQLADLNNIKGPIRTKIQLWRRAGGLYTPESNLGDFLITAKPHQKAIFNKVNKVGVAQTVNNQYSAHSKMKSANSLNYVLAGIEKQEKGLDEVILLDQNDNLSETHIGNLFWIKGNQLYTPSLKTGCIEGVMRRFIMDLHPTKEMQESIHTLQSAEAVFASNASGIQFFISIEGSNYSPNTSNEVLDLIIKRLQKP